MIVILIWKFNYEIKTAIAVNVLMLFGSSIGNFSINARKRTVNGLPLVNFALVVISLPMLLCGALLGVYINRLVPDIVLYISLILTLLQNVKTNYEKLIEQRQIEKNRTVAGIKNKENELLELQEILVSSDSSLSFKENEEVNVLVDSLDLLIQEEKSSLPS